MNEDCCMWGTTHILNMLSIEELIWLFHWGELLQKIINNSWGWSPMRIFLLWNHPVMKVCHKCYELTFTSACKQGFNSEVDPTQNCLYRCETSSGQSIHCVHIRQISCSRSCHSWNENSNTATIECWLSTTLRIIDYQPLWKTPLYSPWEKLHKHILFTLVYSSPRSVFSKQ